VKEEDLKSPFSRSRTLPALAAGLIAVATPAAAAASVAGPDGPATANKFHQTNLVSDLSTVGAQVVDPNLKNAWGLADGGNLPLWVSDNNANVATIYSINVGGTKAAKVGLTVTVPGGRASTMDGSSPTGQVFNPTTGFVVTSKSGSGPALFIFSSESGQISAWNPVADRIGTGTSTATLEWSSRTAVYKGLTIASTPAGTFLYASNFHDGRVDVFNSHFRLVHLRGDFRDPRLPKRYAPFGIQAIGKFIYVTYALQSATKHDDVGGVGHGFVDIFTTKGVMVKRLVSRGALDSPWGLAVAPAGFGPFAGKLLVGNFRNGLIHVFGLFSGKPAGVLRNEHGLPIWIDHLWALRVGTATTGGTRTLLFSAGINDEKDGLVGSINPAG
jgi:uncharacterized protein (TIGR03118 family)